MISAIRNVFNAYIKKTKWFQEEIFPNGYSFWNLSEGGYDIINFGSTSALNAFFYQGINIKGVNLALKSNPLYGDSLLVKNFATKVKKGGHVIITICPFSSLSGNYRDLDDIYYTLLPIKTIPFSSPKRQKKILEIKNHPYRYYPLALPFINLVDMIYPKTKKKTESEMSEDASNWMKSWDVEFGLNGDFKHLSDENLKNVDSASVILNNIIDFCKSINVVPIVMIPPVYHTLGELFTEEIRETVIYSLIRKIKDQSIRFYNYMDDIDFAYNINFFSNSFILNKEGAINFTRRVLLDLGYSNEVAPINTSVTIT